jgi:hypothetical protein
MTPERWQQVKALFAEAMESEPADRAAFLDRVGASCGDRSQPCRRRYSPRPQRLTVSVRCGTARPLYLNS